MYHINQSINQSLLATTLVCRVEVIEVSKWASGVILSSQSKLRYTGKDEVESSNWDTKADCSVQLVEEGVGKGMGE